MVQLSVIIPMYNAEQYIEQCVSSILNQSFKDIEVIIVNDGSTDKSASICEKIKTRDSRVHILHQENGGVIQARYNGVIHSTGQYITFVDADDFVENNAYIYAKKAMEQGVDAILFEISRYFDENNRKIDVNKVSAGLYNRDKIEKVIYPQLIWNFQLNLPGMEPQMGVNIVKKEIILSQYKKVVGRSFWYGEDIAVIYPLYKKFQNLQIIDKCYYQHRQRKEACWSYVANDNYFIGLYDLYTYLITEFKEIEEKYNFRRQIEYLFMYAVELKKYAYGDYQKHNAYLFPFDKVKRNQRIALYGAGAVGQDYYWQLQKLNYCRKIIWVDKKADFINRKEVNSTNLLKEEEFDQIVIAIESRETCMQVKRDLIALGIDESKILF